MLATMLQEKFHCPSFGNVSTGIEEDSFNTFEVRIAEIDFIHSGPTVLNLYYSVDLLCVQAGACARVSKNHVIGGMTVVSGCRYGGWGWI